MRGRVLYKELSVSRRFNRLQEYADAELAQVIYLLGYTHADDWGHIPFCPEWTKLQVIPATQKSKEEITLSLSHIVEVGLWEQPYIVADNQYVYIFNFDEKNRDAIRHRTAGVYPDESGKIPRREYVEKKKLDIDQCLAIAREIRTQFNPKHTTINIANDIAKSITAVTYDDTNRILKPVTINGQQLSVSFLQAMLRRANDIHTLGRWLYRSKNADDIKGYLIGGTAYIDTACNDEYENPKMVDSFINDLFYTPGAQTVKHKI